MYAHHINNCPVPYMLRTQGRLAFNQQDGQIRDDKALLQRYCYLELDNGMVHISIV